MQSNGPLHQVRSVQELEMNLTLMQNDPCLRCPLLKLWRVRYSSFSSLLPPIIFHYEILLGGVGHCFAWHVRVNLGFCFNFKIEELVDSGLTDIWDIIAYFLLPELKYYYE